MPSSVSALAQRLHGGTNVYKSRADCLKVLHAVATSHPPWWSPSCSAFVQQIERLNLAEGSAAAATTRRHPIIVVEGLDGTGKTLITRTLAEKLAGIAISTPPPQLATLRETFRVQDEAISRAFYSAANYMAAIDILTASQVAVVIVDRWWCSTCAMALSNRRPSHTLPPRGDEVYQWPVDLPVPDVGILLCVEEAVRVARIRKRAPEDAEERRLSAHAEMRRTAMEAYRRTGLLVDVSAPSYRVAVNTILETLLQKGVHHAAAPFTLAELDSIEPF